MAEKSKIPQPPTRKAKEIISFIKLIDRKVYLLDGVLHNPEPEDTAEALSADYDKLIAEGASPVQAKHKSELMRLEKFGVGMEHGFYGEEVEPWFPGNFAVLLAPVHHDSFLAYKQEYGETWDVALTKIFLLTYNLRTQQEQYNKGIKPGDTGYVPPFEKDAYGGVLIPGMAQPVYGTLDELQAEIAAFILSCHGQVVGKVGRNYTLVPVTKDEVTKNMPVGFIQAEVEPGVTAMEQILQVSTLFDSDLVKGELKDTGSITDDEEKKLTPSPELTETKPSDSRPSRRLGVIKG